MHSLWEFIFVKIILLLSVVVLPILCCARNHLVLSKIDIEVTDPSEFAPPFVIYDIVYVSSVIFAICFIVFHFLRLCYYIIVNRREIWANMMDVEFTSYVLTGLHYDQDDEYDYE